MASIFDGESWDEDSVIIYPEGINLTVVGMEKAKEDDVIDIKVGAEPIPLVVEFVLGTPSGAATLSAKMPPGLKLYSDYACTAVALFNDNISIDPTTSKHTFYLKAYEPTEKVTIELEYKEQSPALTLVDRVTVRGACSGSGTAGSAPGSANGDPGGSLVYDISLGKTDKGDSAGYLRIHEDRPSSDLFSRRAVKAFTHADARVNTDAVGITSVETGPVATPDTICTLSDSIDDEYTIHFDIDGDPVDINFSKGSSFEEVIITRTEGMAPDAETRVWRFTWSETDQIWYLSEGESVDDLLTRKSKKEQWDSTLEVRTETTIIEHVDPQNQQNFIDESTVEEVYQLFPWGEESISRTIDPNGEVIQEQWEYYDDLQADGNNYGHLKVYTSDTGYWEHYRYNAEGILQYTISQRGDNQYDDSILVTTLADNNILNEYTSEYTVSTYQILASENIIHVNGKQRSTGTTTRSDIQFPIAGKNCEVAMEKEPTALDYSYNPKITSKYFYADEGIAKGKLRASVSPDKRATLYDYIDTTNDPVYGDYRETTITEGLFNTTTYDIDKYWTRRISRANVDGVFWVKEEVYDSTAGWVTQSLMTATITGGTDRVTTRDYYFGGSASPAYTTVTEGGCCGGDEFTDQYGLVTINEHDGIGRLSAKKTAEGTLGKLRMSYTYDGSGRVVTTSRGDFGSEVVIQTNTYDSLGRISSTEDAEGNKTFYTYRKVDDGGDAYDLLNDAFFYQETRAYPHDKDSGPIQVTWTESHGRTVRSFAATTTATDWAGSAPLGTEALTEVRRTSYTYDELGRLKETWTYHSFTGMSLLSDPGVLDTNYYKTVILGYDHLDRPWLTQDELGNIAATVYDDGGRAIEQWRGTDATNAQPTDPSFGGTNGLVMVSKTLYDDNRDGTGDLMSYPTRRYSAKAISTAPSTLATDYVYVDFDQSYAANGDKHVWTKPQTGAGPWKEDIYDAQGRLLESITYTNGSTTFIQAKQTNDYYDDAINDPAYALGRLKATNVHEVDGLGSTTASYLTTTYEYDEAGRQSRIIQPSGAISKTEYDDAGRVERQLLISDDNGTETLTDDTVVTETVMTYDENGNVIKRISYDRNHDATCSGLLSNYTSCAQHRYVYYWYDAAGRLTGQADYGTNNGTDPNPSSCPAPQSSVNVIVTKYDYTDVSSVTVTDNDGRDSVTYFNAAGRKTKTVENNVDDTPFDDTDRTTEYEYNAAGQITTLRAVDPTPANNQVTTYTYGGENVDKSPVPRKDLLLETQYPGGSDVVAFTYYANGAIETKTDQRNIEHTYYYDDTGRLEADAVTTVTGVDDTVLSITRGYDELGRLAKITNHGNAATSADDVTDINGQVTFTYDGYGNLISQTQDIDSEITPGSGVAAQVVQYEYGSTDGRLNSFTYPNGRQINFGYGTLGGISDRLARIEKITNGTMFVYPSDDVIAEYEFVGARRVVRKNYWLGQTTTPKIQLDHYGEYDYTNNEVDEVSGTYAGLDRFGRVTKHLWVDNAASPALPIFDVHHGYDFESNRTYADRQVYYGYSHHYAYDDLNRLETFKAGVLNATKSDLETYRQWRVQDWTLDQFGNQTLVDDSKQTDWYKGTFNVANEYDASPGSRKVLGEIKPDRYSLSATGFGSGSVSIASLGEFVGPSQNYVQIKFNNLAEGNFAGFVLGYIDSNNYWKYVLEQYDNNGITAERVALYEIVDGDKGTPKAQVWANFTVGTNVDLVLNLKKNSIPTLFYDFEEGFNTREIGLITNSANTEFNNLVINDDAVNSDMLGRWINNAPDASVTTDGVLSLGEGAIALGQYSPVLLNNVRLDKFQADIEVTRDNFFGLFKFIFNAKDAGEYNFIELVHSTSGWAPEVYKCVDGKTRQVITDTGDLGNLVARALPTDPLWFRVVCDPEAASNAYITVYQATTQLGLDTAYACYVSADATLPINGGLIGFAGGWYKTYINKLTIRSDSDNNGTFETVEMYEDFTVDANGYAEDQPRYDAAGNMTYDGNYSYTYDGWNRMVQVTRARPDGVDAGTDPDLGSDIATLTYDGLGRRTSKTIANSGDWDRTYYYYYDGWKVVEVRDRDWSVSSDDPQRVLKQYTWGTQYIDELLQIAINQDPQNATITDNGLVDSDEENLCERYFWVLQDANYNVLGLVNAAGKLIERYEYTPYGQRTIFSHGWNIADINNDGKVSLADLTILSTEWGSTDPTNPADLNGGGNVGLSDLTILSTHNGWPGVDNDPLVTTPVLESPSAVGGGAATAGLCDIGHQGLLLDKEFGLINNRNRYLSAKHGRYTQQDPGQRAANSLSVGQSRPNGNNGLVNQNPASQYTDGMNLYQYEKSNPVNNTDPSGLYTLLDAKNSFCREKYPITRLERDKCRATITDQETYDEWAKLEAADMGWVATLQKCPDRICIANDKPISCSNGTWDKLGDADQDYHPKAKWTMRSSNSFGYGQQCAYRGDGTLITEISLAAGTPDRAAASVLNIFNHIGHDVKPFKLAEKLDGEVLGSNLRKYLQVRPPCQGGGKCYK